MFPRASICFLFSSMYSIAWSNLSFRLARPYLCRGFEEFMATLRRGPCKNYAACKCNKRRYDEFSRTWNWLDILSIVDVINFGDPFINHFSHDQFFCFINLFLYRWWQIMLHRWVLSTKWHYLMLKSLIFFWHIFTNLQSLHLG